MRTRTLDPRDEERVVLDALREIRAPFSPEAAVPEFTGLLRSYRTCEVEGDRYAAAWLGERFEKAGLRYRPAEKSRSQLYLEPLPAINSATLEPLGETGSPAMAGDRPRGSPQ